MRPVKQSKKHNKGGSMKKGFTLVELVVVIAIIAILAAVIAPNAFKSIEKARISATVGHLDAIKTAVMQFYTDNSVWPANATTVAANELMNNTNSYSTWDGPYLDKWPSAGQWQNSVYNLRNYAGVNWDGAGGNDAGRFTELTNVPIASARKIDLAIDGVTCSTAGAIRYDNSSTTTANISALISTDVMVN